eukprot:m.171419 g.171419  ORF g.171419 m.171419 type:complete len:599 (-) comp13372_c0_seq1:326-2122(-)
MCQPGRSAPNGDSHSYVTVWYNPQSTPSGGGSNFPDPYADFVANNHTGVVTCSFNITFSTPYFPPLPIVSMNFGVGVESGNGNGIASNNPLWPGSVVATKNVNLMIRPHVPPTAQPTTFPTATPTKAPTERPTLSPTPTVPFTCNWTSLRCEARPNGEFQNYADCLSGCATYSCSQYQGINVCFRQHPPSRGQFNGTTQCSAGCVNFGCSSSGDGLTDVNQCIAVPASAQMWPQYNSSLKCTSRCRRYVYNRTLAQCVKQPYGAPGYANTSTCVARYANYSCSSKGQCLQLPLGTPGPYTSRQQCHDVCFQYACNYHTMQCVPSPFGLANNFDTIDDCQSVCTGFRCRRATCATVPYGSFRSGDYSYIGNCTSVCIGYTCNASTSQCTQVPFGTLNAEYSTLNECRCSCGDERVCPDVPSSSSTMPTRTSILPSLSPVVPTMASPTSALPSVSSSPTLAPTSPPSTMSVPTPHAVLTTRTQQPATVTTSTSAPMEPLPQSRVPTLSTATAPSIRVSTPSTSPPSVTTAPSSGSSGSVVALSYTYAVAVPGVAFVTMVLGFAWYRWHHRKSKRLYNRFHVTNEVFERSDNNPVNVYESE